MTSAAAAAAPSNDARGEARARSKSLPAARAISAKCRAIITRSPCDLPNAWLWRRRWRQRRRARGRRARGGGGVGGAREGGLARGVGVLRSAAAADASAAAAAAAAIGSGGAQWRPPRARGGGSHKPGDSLAPQRPACAWRRGGAGVVGRYRRPVCVGRQGAGVGRRRRQRRGVCDVEFKRIKILSSDARRRHAPQRACRAECGQGRKTVPFFPRANVFSCVLPGFSPALLAVCVFLSL